MNRTMARFEQAWLNVVFAFCASVLLACLLGKAAGMPFFDAIGIAAAVIAAWRALAPISALLKPSARPARGVARGRFAELRTCLGSWL